MRIQVFFSIFLKMDKPSREELRKKLRNKINDKRNGTTNSPHDLAQSVRNDPQSALMSLGVDDPEVLKCAKNMLKNPQAMLSNLKNMLEDHQTTEKNTNKEHENYISDEECPPPENALDKDGSDDEAPPPSLL